MSARRAIDHTASCVARVTGQPVNHGDMLGMKVPCKIQITGRLQYLRILEAHLVTKTVDPFQNNIPNNRKSFSLAMISGWSERHHMIRILQSILKGLIFTGIKFRGDLISRVKWPRNPRIFISAKILNKNFREIKPKMFPDSQKVSGQKAF